MKYSLFIASYNKAIELLRNARLLKSSCHHTEYSSICKEYSRSNDYMQIYEGLVNNNDYDIQLTDDSLFQISIENEECRMLFIQNPQIPLSFEEFLDSLDIEYTENQIEDYKSSYYDFYEQARTECAKNEGAVYMRYDVHSDGYDPGVHAFTHLHIGLKNTIRIPVKVELTPLSFVLFVLRHVYFDKWKSFVAKSQNVDEVINNKAQCVVISDNRWQELDERFLYLM